MLERSRGRPPLEPKDGEEKLTRREISIRQRERLRAAGKVPSTYWIDYDLSESIKKEARKRGFPSASAFIEDLLTKVLLEP